MNHAVLVIAVTALVTMFLRFVPFLLFGGKRETPPYISYLGRLLPYAVMAMLVVYCLRNISFLSAPFGAPELISCAVAIRISICGSAAPSSAYWGAPPAICCWCSWCSDR